MNVDPEFAPLGFIPEMDLATLPQTRLMMAAMAASRLTDRSDRMETGGPRHRRPGPGHPPAPSTAPRA